MYDILALFGLGFSHILAFLFVLTLFYVKFGKSVFLDGLLLIFTSIIVNVALKALFAVPLKPHLLKEGFAFPSGHMQTAAVLYGYVMRLYHRKAIPFLCILILGGIGFGLIYRDYHSLIDVIAAVLFARLILIVYFDVSAKLKPEYFYLSLCGFCLFCFLYTMVSHRLQLFQAAALCCMIIISLLRLKVSRFQNTKRPG